MLAIKQKFSITASAPKMAVWPPKRKMLTSLGLSDGKSGVVNHGEAYYESTIDSRNGNMAAKTAKTVNIFVSIELRQS